MSSRLLWRSLPALIWMGIIFLLSHQPKAGLAHAQPSAFLNPSSIKWSLFWEFFFTVDWDTVAGKSAHIAVYAILAYLLWLALPRYLLVLWITILYGFTDEFHQTFIPGRTGKLSDVLFDSVGAILGIWMLRHIHSSVE